MTKQDVEKIEFNRLVALFEQTHSELQRQAARSVDISLVVRNWLFGWYIVEYESGGAERAELYGKKLIDSLASTLSSAGIRGVSATNLRKFREFYLAYKEIQQTLSVTSHLPENDKKDRHNTLCCIHDFKLSFPCGAHIQL